MGEGELEEEQTQSEMLMERARKAQINIEQLTGELASERGNCQKMENTKMMLERQNKELKAKLEEQLSAEAQERMLAAKSNRKLEKKIKELMMQLDEAEEEISREKAHRRKAQRELDDYVE